MSYNIEARKVAGVVIEANQALTNKGFNSGEVALGLAELIGRIIVEAVSTKPDAEAMVHVVHKHIMDTVRIGAEARDKRIITGV